jgi:quercetin dioxygenase-like cupin family protein
MRSIIGAAFVCACALSQIAAAENEDAPVPIEKASFHQPVFRNDYVMLLNVYIPPGRGSNYHTHSLDQVGVLVEAADQTGQVYGGQPTPARRGTKGSVNYSADSQHPVTHRGSNVGTTPFHNIVVALLQPKASGFPVDSRAGVPAYVQVVDSDRVRAWRLILDPGQSVPAVTQTAPGLRVVVDGGEIVETVPGELDRSRALRNGDFFWQDAGVTRAIRNNGSTRVEFVEIELK